MRRSSPILPTITSPELSPMRVAKLTLHFGGVASNLIAQLQCGIAGALGVIFMSDGRAEQCHDAIAGVLIHRALEAMHAVSEDSEEAIKNLMPCLGVELLGQFHRAFHIGKQYSHLFTFAFEHGLRL